MVVMVKCIKSEWWRWSSVCNSQNGGEGQVFATVRMMVMVKCLSSHNGGDGQLFQQSEWW